MSDKKSFGQFFTQAASAMVQKSVSNIKELRSDIVLLNEFEQKRPASNSHNEQVKQQFKQAGAQDQSNSQIYDYSNLKDAEKEKGQVNFSSEVVKDGREDMTESRVKQIQQEKIRINQQLRKLDQEIAFLKGTGIEGSVVQNDYQKRNKISKNQQAQAKAQRLVKQLNKQRKALQEKRKKQQEKLLEKFQAEQQEKRKLRELQVQKAKQQKRIAIEKRLQDQRRRRQQRKIIDAQSNNLIVQLKKQEKIEKQKSIVPSQLFQVQHKKRMLQNKKKLDFSQIQDHQKRYRIQKLKEQEERRIRQEQSKNVDKQLQNQQRVYSKNRWMELIQEQDKRRKDEQRNKQQAKKLQVEKRNKYAQVVQKVFIPKKKISHVDNNSFQENEAVQLDRISQTPDQLPKVANKTKSQKRRTYDQKIFHKQESLPVIKDNNHMRKKKNELPPTQQLDTQEKQKEALRVIKMRQLRAQTNERLKKLQNKSIEALKRNQTRHKYQNYLGKVNIKKRQDGQQWRKVLDNKQLSSQQKYRELMNKASIMQNKAKLKEVMKRQVDQDAINLYIGSIQAKLALLQKF